MLAIIGLEFHRIIRCGAKGLIFLGEGVRSGGKPHCGFMDHDPLVKDRMFLGLISDWQEFLISDEEAELDLLRQTTRTGRPAGNEQFVEKIEILTGRDLTIKSA